MTEREKQIEAIEVALKKEGFYKPLEILDALTPWLWDPPRDNLNERISRLENILIPPRNGLLANIEDHMVKLDEKISVLESQLLI